MGWLATFAGVGLVATTVLVAQSSQTAVFTVDPLVVRLQPNTRSALVTVTNRSERELRFDVAVRKWDHDDAGEMTLTDTGDIVLVPQILTLRPGQRARVRVGPTGPPVPGERAYRMIVEELPAAPASPTASQVNIRLRLSIPVFLEGPNAIGQAGLAEAAAADGRLSAKIANTGTRHVLVEKIAFQGIDRAGKPTFEAEAPGWYVLGGHSRTFSAAVTAADCAATATLVVDAKVGEQTLTLQQPVDAAACQPR